MISTIAVEDLRVGIYVQLEGGWLSHPFPLSAFRIASAEQIATLRGLGLQRVRWLPEKSDPAPQAKAAGTPPSADGHAAAATSAAAAAALTATARREWLTRQREAARRCERQHGEAAKVWRDASDAAAADPLNAGRTATALTQAMLDKMLDAGDIGIRLITGCADRSAAHALNVTIVSMLIGRKLGLPPAEMLALGTGSLLHDIGKQEVMDRLRHAEEGFTSVEMNAYRDHVAKGVALGKRMGLSADALLVIAQHHEHVDGSGFPQRLTSDKLGIASRIVAIVNRYDNLCNPGSRAPALTPHEAVATLFAQGRGRFDATVLNIFIRMMGVYPAGSLVQLTDDRHALVVGVNSSQPLKPCLLVHDLRISRTEAQLIDLEQVPDVGIRRSLLPGKLPPETLQVLDPRPRVAYYFEPLAQAGRCGNAEELAA